MSELAELPRAKYTTALARMVTERGKVIRRFSRFGDSFAISESLNPATLCAVAFRIAFAFTSAARFPGKTEILAGTCF
jgi:hypothetical protein